MLRLPLRGGVARVVAYPNLDSLVWTATDTAPALDRVLAFDDEAGSIAFVDRRSRPGRLDLRLGTIAIEGGRTKLSSITSADGTTIYAVDNVGSLRRFTPSGAWTFKPPLRLRDVFPQTDGTVVLFGSKDDDSTVAWRMHPPAPRLLDTVDLPAVQRTVRTQLGDRIYLVNERQLVGLRTRDLQAIPPVEFATPIASMAATPSGDRLFVVNDSSSTLSVLDRYRERITQTIELGAQPDELRIDPLGRYLLVRQAKTDSAWVIAVGTGAVAGKVSSRWRPDLPFIAPDGAVAVADGKDVVFVDAETLREAARVSGGAADFWYSFLWTGFRPRDASLDPAPDIPLDTLFDTVSVIPPVTDTMIAGPPAPAPDTTKTRARGWTLSFAALLNEDRARQLAAEIRVRGENARVVTSERDGTTIYRVVLGPYPTREDADRAGRESGQSNWWIYEGNP